MIQYPVLEVIPQLKTALSSHRTVILQASPGAGKSTVLPMQLLGEAWLGARKIFMLEPRRLAARSVAERMSELLGEKVGETIGYRVRFDTKVGARTKIEVVTEGILTRMIQSGNILESAGLIIFDEFHERNLQGDLALALSLQVQKVVREDLRILIMSATLDGDQLSSALGGVPIITSTGKQFPVKVIYAQRDTDTLVAVRASQAIKKAIRADSGDILVFLPGAGEIRKTAQILGEDQVKGIIYPLYGDLPYRQQQEAIIPRKDGLRKIVLATSIAETSLTIEGVHVVIDGGLSRVSRFDSRSGLTRLDTLRVTKDSADQRAGRAGRLGPGICYRLWDESTQRNLLTQRKPEILEADLATVVLEVAQWGVKDIKALDWITPPPPGAMSQATELLMTLEAMDDKGITSRGIRMLSFPTHPRIAHMLLSAEGAVEKGIACDVASLLEERDPSGKEASTDLSLRIEVLRKWRAGEPVYADRAILERIERLASNWRSTLGIDVDNSHPPNYLTGKVLMTAYPERIARQQSRQGTAYVLANGRVAKLPDHDPLMHEGWLCVAQLDAGQREGKIFMAAPVHETDLHIVAKESPVVKWDDDRSMVIGAVETRVGGLLLSSKPVHHLPESDKNKVIFQMIRNQGLEVLDWDEPSRSLQARIQSTRSWHKDEGWPDVSDDHLLASLESWLSPYLDSLYKLGELKKLNIKTILLGLVPWNLQSKLNSLAPSGLDVPSGSVIPVQYFADGRAPVMEVRLQEMFGLLETPTVNEGRTKVLLHLLSPGYKPVQVTQDLRSFWETTYHDVRKELRMRYPKHSWPEDPWTATAVKGAKRRPQG